MKIDRKFQKKIDKLIAKYAVRETPLSDDDEIFIQFVDEECEESDIEVIKKYYFYNQVATVEKESMTVFGLDVEKEDSTKTVYIQLFDEQINNELKKIVDTSSLFSSTPEIEIKDLYYCINDLRKRKKELEEEIRKEKDTENNDSDSSSDSENSLENILEKLNKVINFTEELFKDNYESMDSMIEKGIIDYESIWYYLDKTDEVFYVKLMEKNICYKHCGFEYMDTERKLVINGSVICYKKNKLVEHYYEYDIAKFTGTKKIKNLHVKKYCNLTNEEKQTQIEYGKKVESIGDTIKYMKLKGNQYSTNKQSVMTFVRDCRVIIDNGGLDKYDSSPFKLEELGETKVKTDDDYSLVFPFVGLYSMGTSKTWGVSHVADLVQIDFRADAFDYLVLEQHKKDILMGLIRCHRKDYSDFIDGKGQGLVFLLNGPPGVGKTLTAEATAEYLNKPLYNVNVGDLGTNPEVMEEILNRIIEYTERWGAILLIDEADIFLEEREYSNVLRNSMVSTFLKFLEFNKGIIFLTTNRLKSMDDAVKSRVNLFMTYTDLNYDRRIDVWKSILSKWKLKLSDDTIYEVAEYKLNGREIRNYMRLIVSLLEDRKLEFNDDNMKDILEECHNITNEFNDNLCPTMYQ